MLEQDLSHISRLISQGQLQQAARQLRQLHQQWPEHPQVMRFSGILAFQSGDKEQAEQWFRQRLELESDNIQAINDLATALLDIGGEKEVVTMLETHPDSVSNPDSLFNLARAYKGMGQTELAVQPLTDLLKAHPEHMAALIMLGDVYKALGQLQEAGQQYRKAIKLRPDRGVSWWSLSNLKTDPLEDTELQALQHHADQQTGTSMNRVYFEFARAKALEDRGQDRDAFKYFSLANRTRREMEPWNVRHFEQWLAAIRESEQQLAIPSRIDEGNKPRPIFIVGLPRSGSTLTEQVLAAHSQVTGASELPWIPRLVAQKSKQQQQPLTQWLIKADQHDWQQLGHEYLEKTEHWQQTLWFTDKLPGNFAYIGAILCMLPQALVINIRRDPMDVGLSCYRQLFIGGQQFSYDLEDIAVYWKAYDRHMRYWAERMESRVLDLHYESLVSEPEPTIHQLLDFIGLPWEADCLQPHKAKRAVNTASAAQVRQPFNTKGIGYWKRYKEELKDLQAALED